MPEPIINPPPPSCGCCLQMRPCAWECCGELADDGGLLCPQHQRYAELGRPLRLDYGPALEVKGSMVVRCITPDCPNPAVPGFYTCHNCGRPMTENPAGFDCAAKGAVCPVHGILE